MLKNKMGAGGEGEIRSRVLVGCPGCEGEIVGKSP